MIEALRRNLFSVRFYYANPIERQRAVGLVILNWILILTALAWFAFVVLPDVMERPQGVIADEFLTSLVVPVVCIGSILLIQRGRLQTASQVFTGLLLIACVPPTWENFTGAPLILLLLPVVAAGLLLDRRGVAVVAVILIASAVYRGYLMSLDNEPVFFDASEDAVYVALVSVLSLGLATIFMFLFSGSAQKIVGSVLQDGTQLRQIAGFASRMSEETDEASILQQAIDLVTVTLKYSSAQILLVDPSGTFTRRVRSGLGRQESGLRVLVGGSELNLVNEALRSRQQVRVSATSTEDRRSILIPPANSAAVIPIVYNEMTLGVLETQSQRSTIADEEVQSLALLADQIAHALVQAQALQELQRTNREQQELNARLQQQLGEFRLRSQEVVSTGWSSYLQGRGAPAIGFDIQHGDTPTTILASDLPDEIRPALERGEMVVQAQGDERIISVPITFRGETLGAMSFAIGKDAPLTERQLEMVQVVSNRLGLALENTRLFEQSQAQALRERKANEAAGSLVRAVNVNAVLNLAAQNFNEALNAIYTRVYLQPDFMAERVLQTDGTEEE